MLRTQPLFNDDGQLIGDMLPSSPSQWDIGGPTAPIDNIYADNIVGASILDTQTSIVFANSPYTALAADSTILANATGGNIVVNLPTAVGISGKTYTIKKTDASVNTVTIDASAAQTIDGTLTRVLSAQYATIVIQSNGANWNIVSSTVAANVTTKVFADSPYTALASDSTILANATGGNILINLPTAVGIVGKIYTIKKTDVSVNTVTVDASGAQTIDGAATKVLSAQYSTVVIQSDGANWSILSEI